MELHKKRPPWPFSVSEDLGKAPLLARLRAYRNTGTFCVPERGVAAASADGVVSTRRAESNVEGRPIRLFYRPARK